VKFGIAGWPLRNLSLDDLASVIDMTPSKIVEIPKDLLNSVSVKKLFEILKSSQKTAVLAGTTDFTNMAGLTWDDYQRYLDIQVVSARFLGCKIIRVFLQANTRKELELSLDRIGEYARRFPDIEMAVETHGGFESTKEGIDYCINQSSIRFVVDFAAVSDDTVKELILGGGLRERIVYFQLRNLPGFCEEEELIDVETRAVEAHPHHDFLWEPKTVSGYEAVKIFQVYCN